MKRAFWAGRRVLVTGHTGFKGAWLTHLLGELGAVVTGYALAPPTEPSAFGVSRAAEGMESIEGDICDLSALTALVERTNPDIVVHMAAQSLVRESYREPLETYRVNVLGTATLLDALRAVPGRRAVIVVTSDKCYENKERLTGYQESDALGGHDPYSNSKACAELVAAAYRDSFFGESATESHSVAIATARAGNVIGGGDWATDRIVPDIVNAVHAGSAAQIRNPAAHRPWQHVLDALYGYLTLAERLWEQPAEHADAWNFGPTEAHVLPVSMLADDICRHWGGGASWEHDGGEHPHEAKRLTLNAEKARTRLGLERSTSYETTIEWTVDWYRAYHNGDDMRQVTLQQIRRFCEGVAS